MFYKYYYDYGTLNYLDCIRDGPFHVMVNCGPYEQEGKMGANHWPGYVRSTPSLPPRLRFERFRNFGNLDTIGQPAPRLRFSIYLVLLFQC